MSARPRIRLALAHAAAAAMLWPLAGCAPVAAPFGVFPANLTIVPGERGAVVLDAVPTGCQQCPPGTVFDYTLQNAPGGVTYTIDRSQQSADAPGLVRIAFDVAATAPASLSAIAIEASVDGRSLGGVGLTLRIPPLSTPETATPIAVGAGPDYSVSALADGTVWTWGRGSLGQLGLGAGRDASALPMMVPDLTGVRSVAAGASHVLALTGGQLWGWGSNDHGQIGSRTTLGDVVSVPTPIPLGARAETIAAGSYHSLALDTNRGVWSWGDYHAADGRVVRNAPPVRVSNLPPIRAIAAGLFESYAVDVDGGVWQWSADPAVQPHQIAGLRTIESISASAGTLIAVDRDGNGWISGNNTALIQEVSFPTLPAGGKHIEVPPIDTSSLAYSNAAVVTRLRSVWEWGALGDAAPVLTPVRVDVPAARGVAAATHRMALLDCGALWGWGKNVHGQLGDGTTDARAFPMPVLGIGDDRNCARVGLRAMVTGAPGTADAISVEPGPVETNGVEFESVATYPRGTTVTLRARPELLHTFVAVRGADTRTMRSAFERWALDCAGTDLTTTMVLDRTRRCAAVYRNADAPPPPPPPAGFTLIVAINAPPGSSGSVIGTSAGNGINCLAAGGASSMCSQSFPAGTAVQVKPAGGEDSQFGGWTSGCDSITGANRCNVSLTGDRTVAATFIR